VTPDPVVALFAARLRRERLARDWSLRDLTAASGVSEAGLCEIENAQADPRLSTVTRIARGLGIPLVDMVSESPCERCDGTPPAGFICGDCGRKGGEG